MTLHVANHMRTQQVRSWGWWWVQLSGALRLLLLTRCCCSRVAEQTSASATARHTPAKRPNGGGAKFGARGAGIRTLVHTHTSDPRERVRIGSWFMNTLTPEPAPSRRGSIPRPATLGLVAFPRENQCNVQTTEQVERWRIGITRTSSWTFSAPPPAS